MSDRDLERFVTAQAGGEFAAALAEMKAGRKHSHWIWYVFPQLAGLGTSQMSRTYAIRDREEAESYLRHPLLGARLVEITTAVAAQVHKGVPVDRLMGSSIDAAKLVSSLTLFGDVARRLSTPPGDANAAFADLADEILTAAAVQGYPACRHTRERLSRLAP
jgi:uncharacterized protein (DUF1810 family)